MKVRFIMNEEKFIELIRQNRCLWDTTSRLYVNRLLKEKVWTGISRHFPPMTALHCKHKWKKLKDARAANRKRQKTDQPGYKPYRYAKAMSFLDVFDSVKENGSDSTNLKEEAYPLNSSRLSTEDYVPEITISEPDEFIDHDYGVPETLQVEQSIVVDEQKRPDEHTHFALSLVPLMRNLAPHKASEVRIQIYQLLHQATFEN